MIPTGFLSLKDPQLGIPGNAGLKDQVLALKWIKKYISYFNGDCNNITVFGESAGGASTHYMMLTEQTRGLFHKGIPMSGCVLNYWANTPITHMAYRLAHYHGYQGPNNDKEVLKYLMSLESSKLVNHKLLTKEDGIKGYLFPFGPTVESYVGPDCVIPKAPEEMLKTAWSNNIPMMFGGCSFEGLLHYPKSLMFPEKIEMALENPERLIPIEVQQKYSLEENRKLAASVLKMHLGDKPLGEDALMDFLDVSKAKKNLNFF